MSVYFLDDIISDAVQKRIAEGTWRGVRRRGGVSDQGLLGSNRLKAAAPSKALHQDNVGGCPKCYVHNCYVNVLPRRRL